MKRAFLIIVITMICLSFFTCKKPGDKTGPKIGLDSLNTSAAANKTGVENLLLNAYGLLDGTYINQPGATWATGTDNWLYGSVAGGDAHKGGSVSDESDAMPITVFTETNVSSFLDPKWKMNITGIRYANAVLNELPLIKDGSVSAVESTQIKAEARFLRGFYELELAKLWRNVPYIDETVPYDHGYSDVSNNGPIWDKIEADFNAAVQALPTTQAQAGRPNKYAAEAFLAKTLLFDHKYAQAGPLLTDLITNGVTTNGTKYALGPYANNFNPSTKNGAEGVFVIQAVVHNGTEGQDGNAGAMLNFPKGGPAVCCGFFQPSFSFVNAFKTDEATGLPLLDTYNDSDLKSDQGVDSGTPFTPTTVTLDSRLDWSVGRRGIPYLDWGIMPGQIWCNDQAGEGPYVNIKSVYYQAAQATTSESYGGWAANQATSNSYNAIRFADVLLWAAEVEIETGNLQKAEEYVNIIRTRAADASGWVHTYRDPANPLNGFTATPAANYKVGLYTGQFAANGQSYARKAVYFERMLELGMEGHRFFDLQRWDGTFGGPGGGGFMANILNAYVTHEKAVAGYSGDYYNANFAAGKNELYPIPKSQIDLAHGNVKQNPGY